MAESTDLHDSGGELQQGVGTLLGAMRAGIGGGTPAPAAAGNGDVAHDREDLDRAVGQMMAQRPAGATSTAVAQGKAPASPPIESLDAELAEVADNLIAGEFAGEDEILNTAPAAPPPVVVAPVPKAQPESVPVPKVEAKAEPPKPEAKVEPAPVAESPPPPPKEAPKEAKAPAAAVPMPATLPAPAAPRAPGKSAEREVEPAPDAISKTSALAAVVRLAGELVVRCAAIVSGPLKRKPQSVRDTVGWIALVTIFWAACLWVYLIFIRSPHAPDPEPLPTKVAKAETSHEEGHEGHGAKKPPAKKSEKAKPPAKDAHGKGGEH